MSAGRQNRPGHLGSRPELSAARRQQAREAIQAFNERQHLAPKCGARARTTGEPCRKLAMANGRCQLHGGRTPKGEGWHRPRWPKASAPHAAEKLNRKVADHDRAYRQREARREAMTPEERAAHDAWQKTHRPGDPKERRRARARRKQDAEAAALIARPEEPRTPTPAEIELSDLLERLRAELRRLESPSDDDGSIFS